MSASANATRYKIDLGVVLSQQFASFLGAECLLQGLTYQNAGMRRLGA
jgi:hypothetical protein